MVSSHGEELRARRVLGMCWRSVTFGHCPSSSCILSNGRVERWAQPLSLVFSVEWRSLSNSS